MKESEKNIIASTLDELILKAAPKATKVEKYGGVLYTLYPDEKEGQFCGVFKQKNHVNLSFANGNQLKDPQGVLLGTGKFRRHLNFASIDELDSKMVLKFLKQSAKI